MEPKIALFFMRFGMVILILGSVIFLLIGAHQNPMDRLIVGWAAACATAIFVAGRSGIDSLNEEVRRLQRKARRSPETDDRVIDFLEVRSLNGEGKR